MKILTHRQIKQKITRLAYEIYEHNFDIESLILIGVNDRGMEVANLLLQELLTISPIAITLSRLVINPADPLDAPVHLEIPVEELEGQHVILVDDVANTGRTLFYAMQPLMHTLLGKMEIAVLVDRKHKAFPIQVNYVGLSLATTFKQTIDVEILEVAEFGAFLN